MNLLWKQTKEMYITPLLNCNCGAVHRGGIFKVPVYPLLAVQRASPPFAKLSSHRLGHELVSIQPVEVPAPPGRW